MSKYINATVSNFDDLIKEGVVLVYFWAPWSGSCRMLAPVIEQLATEYDGVTVKISKLNTDEEKDVAVKFGIKAIPTMLIFKNGILVDRMVGVSSKVAIKDKLEKYI
jgi:thioredoxin 1